MNNKGNIVIFNYFWMNEWKKKCFESMEKCKKKNEWKKNVLKWMNDWNKNKKKNYWKKIYFEMNTKLME